MDPAQDGRPSRRRVRRFDRAARRCLVVFVAVSVLGACRGDDGTDIGRDGTPVEVGDSASGTTSSPVRRELRSHAELVEVLEGMCSQFFRSDPVVPEFGSWFELTRFAQRRRDAIEQALQSLDAVVPTAADRELTDLLDRRLTTALTAVEPWSRGPLDDRPPDEGAVAAINRSQQELGQIAVALIDAGAVRCTPAVVAPARPSPPEAGRLVEREPAAVVTLDNPIADPRSIVAAEGGIVVGQLRTHQLARIDPARNEIVARADMAAGGPRGITAVGGSIWAGGEDRIEEFDAVTLRRRGAMLHADLGLGSDGFQFSGSDSLGLLWACGLGRIVSIDASTRTEIARAEIAGSCTGVQPAGADEVVFATLADGVGTLVFADARTLAVRRSIPQPNPVHRLAAGDGYVVTYLGPHIVVLDESTGNEVGRFLNRSTGDPGPIVDGVFWATVTEEWRVLRFEIATGRLEELVSGPGAYGLAELDGDLWVTNSDAATVVRYSVVPWSR